MTDENLESNLTTGSAGSPNPSASSGQGVQLPSGFNAEQLLQLLEPLIDKKVQSTKDRRIAELEKMVSGFQPVLDKFKGIVPDDKLQEIQRDLEFEDLKRKVYGTNETSAPTVGKQNSDAAVGLTSVIDQGLELPLNDSRVTDLKLKFGNDPIAYLREAHKLKSQLSSTSPTPAEMPLPQGGAKTEKSVEALKADYIKEMTDARGRRDLGKLVQEKYRKLGLDIGSVDFRF